MGQELVVGLCDWVDVFGIFWDNVLRFGLFFGLGIVQIDLDK